MPASVACEHLGSFLFLEFFYGERTTVTLNAYYILYTILFFYLYYYIVCTSNQYARTGVHMHKYILVFNNVQIYVTNRYYHLNKLR